jgi:hypothetical protein
MKPKYKFRKQWENIAKELGMSDKQFHVAATDSITKRDHMVLVNNHRRFVRGMCDLPLAEQEAKLKVFAEKMTELKAAQVEAKTEAEKDMVGIVQAPETKETV